MKKINISFLIVFTSLLLVQCDWNYDPRPFLDAGTIELENLSVEGELRTVVNPIKQYGHVWSSTIQEPTLENSDGFSELASPENPLIVESRTIKSTIENINADKDIYYRAYAIEEGGNVYYSDPVGFILGKDSWVHLADFPGDRRTGGISFTHNGIGYIGLGSSGPSFLDDFWRFDTLGNKWTELGKFPGAGRRNAVAFVIDNKAYVGSGEGEQNGPFDDFYVFNLNTQQWETTTIVDPIPTKVAAAAVISTENFAVVAGGEVAGGARTKEVWKFENNTWTAFNISDYLPSAEGRSGMTAFVLGNTAYFGLGREGVAMNSFYRLNLTNLQWNPTPIIMEINNQPIDGRVNASSFVIGDFAYVGCGASVGVNPVRYRDFYKFSVTEEWSTISDFTGDKRENAIHFALNGQGYVLTGIADVPNAGTASVSDVWTYFP